MNGGSFARFFRQTNPVGTCEGRNRDDGEPFSEGSRDNPDDSDGSDPKRV